MIKGFSYPNIIYRMWHIYFHNATFRIQQSLCQGWLLDEAIKITFCSAKVAQNFVI